MAQKFNFVLRFDELDKGDENIAGVNGVGLGEMTRAGFKVPDGFILSTKAYFAYIRENKLAQKISDLLSTASFERADSLAQVSGHIKKLFIRGSMSEELVKEIYLAYRKLSGIFKDAKVDVHSSPTMICPSMARNDMECKGEANLILKIRESWTSLFEPAEILRRHEGRVNHFRYGMAVVVQKAIKPGIRGVIFSADPVGYDKTKIIIEEIFAAKKINTYEIRKADLEIIGAIEGGKRKLSNGRILDLARMAKKIEQYYYFPQEIEWVVEKNRIYIIKIREIASSSALGGSLATTNRLKPSEKLQLILKGVGASAGIVAGKVKIVSSGWQIDKIDRGDVLVVAQTNQSYIRVMKKAAAIITDYGGRTSHAAVVSRELGIPCVAGAENAVNVLKNGSIVTVNGGKGEVYKGSYFHGIDADASGGLVMTSNLRTATRVYVNLSQAGLIAKVAAKNVDGVIFHGNEFMRTDIGVHPEKLLKDRRGDIYSERLADQIRIFCKEFTSRQVVYRISDFKANEYGKLDGGDDFENTEQNPLLGYRGSLRHIRDTEAFKLEIKAVKIARQRMGHANLCMMIPFCRTIKELKEIKKMIFIEGFQRSFAFKIWMAVEIPSNVILIDDFITEGIDGVSIGLDDLVMLMLGTDLQNDEVAQGFDEMNPAVLYALEKVIKACHKHHITSSIHTKYSSINHDLLEKLIAWGITSISVTPDAIDSTREKIFGIERKLIEKRHHGKN